MADYACTLRPDAERNVLYMTQSGSADREHMLELKARYVEALASMRPGFVLVHDQRAVEAFTDAAMEVGKELIALTGAHRPSRVIRIAPEALLARTRVSRVLANAGARYDEVRVSTPEEAERLLDDPGAR